MLIFADISTLKQFYQLMNLEKILSVSGKPGLYRLIAQSRNGVIIESLGDKKRMIASASERISRLSEISMFTRHEDKPLKEIFKLIREKFGNDLPVNPKSDNNALLDFLSQVLPDFDRERVYPSDIKKLVSWYLILKDFPEIFREEETGSESEAPSR